MIENDYTKENINDILTLDSLPVFRNGTPISAVC